MTVGTSPAPFNRHVLSNRLAAVEAALTLASETAAGGDPAHGGTAGG